MKPSIKAAIFSAIVCPGAGHCVLKHYRRAIGFFAVALVAIGILMMRALQQATFLADEIANGDIPLDPQIIAQKVHEAVNGDNSLSTNFAAWSLFLCWAIAIVDAYRLGKQQESAHAMATTAK